MASTCRSLCFPWASSLLFKCTCFKSTGSWLQYCQSTSSSASTLRLKPHASFILTAQSPHSNRLYEEAVSKDLHKSTAGSNWEKQTLFTLHVLRHQVTLGQFVRITSEGWWNHKIQTHENKRKLLFSFSVSIKPQTGTRHQTNTTPTYFSIKFTHLNKKWQNNNNAICQPGKEEHLPLPILTSSLSI